MRERLKKIINYSGLSERAFAIKCGINQPTLFNQLKGIRSISLESVLAIGRTFPEVSRDWLFMGEGEMLKSQNKDSERINCLVDAITTMQEAINAKNDTIATLIEKIKQLETQLSIK